MNQEEQEYNSDFETNLYVTMLRNKIESLKEENAALKLYVDQAAVELKRMNDVVDENKQLKEVLKEANENLLDWYEVILEQSEEIKQLKRALKKIIPLATKGLLMWPSFIEKARKLLL